MKTDYKINDFDMDLAKMADNMAIEAANEILESLLPRTPNRWLQFGGSLPTHGCLVRMNQCEKCAHSEDCILRTFRKTCLEVASAAICNVSRYYENLEGGEQ